MTERKPFGVEWQSWIEGHISQARSRGEFDNLPGAGRPIPDLQKPYDESWWAKQLMAREGASWLPGSLQLRKDVERTLEHLDGVRSESTVRDRIRELNDRIIRSNATCVSGPASTVSLLDEEDVLAGWREASRLRPTTGLVRTVQPDRDATDRRRWLVAGLALGLPLVFAGALTAALI